MEIVNRVINSNLITIDLADYYISEEKVVYDMKQNLFMESILREKDFREFVKCFDWTFFKEKHVALTCSVDAIIPSWAYMIVVSKLQPYALNIVFGGLDRLEEVLFLQNIAKVNWDNFEGAKVVIKGCGDIFIPNSIFVEVTNKLLPYATSIMYGEPCSTVPVYKKNILK